MIIVPAVSDEEAKKQYPGGWKARSPTSGSSPSRADRPAGGPGAPGAWPLGPPAITGVNGSNERTARREARMRTLAGLAVVALAVAVGTPALGAPLVEFEIDGTATNNTRGTAQAVPSSAFTTPVPATVFAPPGFPRPRSRAPAVAPMSTSTRSPRPAARRCTTSTTSRSASTRCSRCSPPTGPASAATPTPCRRIPEPSPGSILSSGHSPSPGPGTYSIAVSQFPNIPSAFCAFDVA